MYVKMQNNLCYILLPEHSNMDMYNDGLNVHFLVKQIVQFSMRMPAFGMYDAPVFPLVTMTYKEQVEMHLKNSDFLLVLMINSACNPSHQAYA